MVLLSLAISPNSPDDARRLTTALEQLARDDSHLHVRPGQVPGEVVIGGTGDEYLEVVVDRLKREFHVEGRVGRLQVAYKEALTRPAEGETKYARRTGDRGEYAHVKLYVQPCELGTGYTVESEMAGRVIPAPFIQAIELGVKEALTRGVLAGYPVDDVRVVVYDGSYHETDSSEIAFRLAAAMAFEDAAKKAAPLLLEPVMRVEVIVPREHVGDVTANLSSRRGVIQSHEERGAMHIISARVPLAEMFSYRSDLRMRTRGRGTYTMEFDTYVPAPPPDQGDHDSWVSAPRKPLVPLKDRSIALPEPDENGAEQ